MSKVLAETTGDFMITNYPDQIEAHRPSVVTRDSFIDSRISLGQVRLLMEMPDHATEDGWIKQLQTMKVDLTDREKVRTAAEAYARSAPPADEKDETELAEAAKARAEATEAARVEAEQARAKAEAERLETERQAAEDKRKADEKAADDKKKADAEKNKR